jgi:hypothetical protein
VSFLDGAFIEARRASYSKVVVIAKGQPVLQLVHGNSHMRTILMRVSGDHHRERFMA